MADKPGCDALVTGAAGFVGAAVCKALLNRGNRVVGVDNLSDYYDVRLKQARVAEFVDHPGFEFVQQSVVDDRAMRALFDRLSPPLVIHLAAQAGVRYSTERPDLYIEVNLTGFGVMLECCRHAGAKHLVFASTSSVYGANTRMPFKESDSAVHPVSLYAATKKSNELMAHAYAHLYGLPVTGLRFFTVYGPWMRPDMALYKFAQLIVKGEPIPVFNGGNMVRDFTYIDDVVDGVVAISDQPAAVDPGWDSDHPNPASGGAPYRIYNVGNGKPVALMRYIELLEEGLGKTAVKDMLPMQDGDVPGTYASIDALHDAVGYAPHTPVEIGVHNFTQWFKDYHHV